MRISLLTGLLILALGCLPARADINVVTSIKPVHSLVSGIMLGTGNPYLIVNSSASPHAYSMKPSDAAALKKADLVFWIGEDLESFLKTSIANLSKKSADTALIRIPGIRLLELRKDFAPRQLSGESHHHGDDHTHDPHIWLDTDNVRVMLLHISRALAAADPANREIYEKNTGAMLARLQEMDVSLKSALAPYSSKPFIVFHDSWQYFENRFGLRALGSVTNDPEAQLGARHILELVGTVRRNGVKCIFSEPQFDPGIVERIAADTGAVIAVLDPLGAEVENGPDLYFEMMNRNSRSIIDCFSKIK